MILYRDKRYIGNSDHPNDDWIGDADYVIDDNSAFLSFLIVRISSSV